MASLFLGLAAPAEAATGELKPSSVLQLPAFSLGAEGGKAPLTLPSLEGKVVLLNFWATWCLPCVKEMPSLDRLQEAYGSRGLIVVPASQDLTGFLTIRTFYRQRKLTHLKSYWDEGGAAFRALGLSGLPTSFLIGRDGKVIAEVTGDYDWMSDAGRKAVEKALEAEAPAETPEDA